MLIPYFSQCDRLRIFYKEGEALWQEMMDNRFPVVLGKAMGAVDATDLLDEDETLESLFHYHLDSDPEAQFYTSSIRGEEVYFLQSSGFEMIFMPESISKTLTLSDEKRETPKLY